MDSTVIVIVDVICNGLGESFEGRIVLLRTIKHFILRSAKEVLHNAVVIAVPFSGHGLNDSMLLKFFAVECVLALPTLI